MTCRRTVKKETDSLTSCAATLHTGAPKLHYSTIPIFHFPGEPS